MGRCFFEDDCNEPEEQRLAVGSRHNTQHGSASFEKFADGLFSENPQRSQATRRARTSLLREWIVSQK